MSVPDHLLDEPDPELCDEHHRAKPCKECRAAYYDDLAYDAWRDDLRDKEAQCK